MTRIVHDPQFRQEVEVTAALRDGLRELERSGTLASLLRSPAAHRRRVSLALAATILVAVSGGVISYFVGDHQQVLAPAVEVETLRFETVRGGTAQADVSWRPSGRPVQLEMVFDVGPSPAGTYRVTLRGPAGTQVATTIDRVIETAPGGEVVLLLDGALLTTGNYDVRLEPSSAGRPDAIVTYTLKIHDNSDQGS